MQIDVVICRYSIKRGYINYRITMHLMISWVKEKLMYESIGLSEFEPDSLSFVNLILSCVATGLPQSIYIKQYKMYVCLLKALKQQRCIAQKLFRSFIYKNRTMIKSSMRNNHHHLPNELTPISRTKHNMMPQLTFNVCTSIIDEVKIIKMSFNIYDRFNRNVSFS